MKKNIKYFSLVALFFVFGFLGSVNFAKAACCITPGIPHVSGSVCVNPSASGTCASGIPPVPGPLTCEQMDANNDSICENIDSSTPTPPPVPPPSAPTTTTTTFTNPIGFTTVTQLLNSVLNNLMGIIAIISITFIVIGGIMYMTSGGNEAMVTRAKKTWTGAVVGLAIALAAPTFLKEIQAILGGNTATSTADAWVSNALTIQQIATRVLNLLLSVIGILAIIALVIGGGMYLTAYGDEKRVDDGKKIIKYAIIGIAVSLSALVVIRQVGELLGSTM